VTSILVVGSVAYDTVETPFGRVGRDFGEAQLAAFRGRPIDLSGLERMDGETFLWQGKYSYDLNSRETICTELNVFEFFKPKIPAQYRHSSHVFLGNIDPVLQRDVLEQVERPQVVACDTMNFWISGKPEELRRTLERVDVLLINDAEARQLSGEWNIVKAARAIRAMGPRTLVLKKGEHGVLMFSDQGSFAAPAYPLEAVFDPTGAGDTFAGGFLGYLASSGEDGDEALRRAVIMGSTLASFCVEAFSLDRLLTLSRPEVDERFRLFRRLTSFEAL
jgi:hypothetical protein